MTRMKTSEQMSKMSEVTLAQLSSMQRFIAAEVDFYVESTSGDEQHSSVLPQSSKHLMSLQPDELLAAQTGFSGVISCGILTRLPQTLSHMPCNNKPLGLGLGTFTEGSKQSSHSHYSAYVVMELAQFCIKVQTAFLALPRSC